MPILAILNIIRANWQYAIMGVLVIALGVSRMQLAWVKAEYKSHLANDAALALKASEEARQKEQFYAKIAQDAEKQHADDAAKTLAAFDANRKLLAGGVRFKAACRSVPAGAGTSGNPVDGTAAVELPSETVGDLLTLARDADAAADYARAGHNWAKSLKEP